MHFGLFEQSACNVPVEPLTLFGTLRSWTAGWRPTVVQEVHHLRLWTSCWDAWHCSYPPVQQAHMQPHPAWGILQRHVLELGVRSCIQTFANVLWKTVQKQQDLMCTQTQDL